MDARVLKIGECWLDIGRHGVIRDGELIHIEPRDFSVLLQLVENAPNIVASRSLLRSAWRHKVVGDNALHQAIGRLRKALGDSARQPRFIQTQSKLGYQFIAPVTAVDSARDPSFDISPIAVLPFKDYSEAPSNAYFADGLCFEVCNELLSAGVQVISLDRAARIQRRGFTDLEVGGRVGAKAVLCGSIMVADEQLRVTAYLADVESERQMWSDRYDRQSLELFSTHTNIAQCIVRSMLEQGRGRRVSLHQGSPVVPLRAHEKPRSHSSVKMPSALVRRRPS